MRRGPRVPLKTQPAGFRPIRVVDIHLDSHGPLVDIPVPEHYGAVFGIVRLHGVPLLSLELPVTDGCCARQVQQDAILEHADGAILPHLVADALTTGELPIDFEPAALLRASHPHYAGPWPAVTVAVCTRDRPEDLARVLDSLLRVEYPSMELLVIDNAPAGDGVQQLLSASYPSVRYVRELRPGLNWARNRAILEAGNEILAFVDDDVVVEPEWLRALATVFAQHPDVMVVTGLVIPHELESEAQVLFEQHGGLGRGFARRWVRVARGETLTRAGNVTTFGTGANMAFRRAIFDRVGGFDPALDAGTIAAAGGDTEIFLRLLKAGSTLVYEPAAVVRHRHRREYSALRAQLINWSIGVHAALTATMLRYPEERVALTAFMARLLLLYYPRKLAQAMTASAVRADLVSREYGAAFVGLLRYPAARRDAISVAQKFSAGPPTYVCPGRASAASPRATPTSRDVSVDLAQHLPAVLPNTDESDRVRLIIMRSSEVLGAVDVVSGGAPVSRIRLSDTLAAFSLKLVDAPRFARALARRLAGGD